MKKPQEPVRRIGLIGGSFDPVHMGHLILAQDAAEKLELSSVLFIPAAIPPHKQHLQQAAADHRVKMLELATESDLRFSVSDMEITRGGVSYTIDTLRALKAAQPDDELVMVVGADTLVELHTWYRIDEVLELCEVASFVRPGESDIDDISGKIQRTDALREKLLGNLIEAHLIEISSTEIRMRVAEGLRIRYLVPAEVEMYICEHGLYQG